MIASSTSVFLAVSVRISDSFSAINVFRDSFSRSACSCSIWRKASFLLIFSFSPSWLSAVNLRSEISFSVLMMAVSISFSNPFLSCRAVSLWVSNPSSRSISSLFCPIRASSSLISRFLFKTPLPSPTVTAPVCSTISPSRVTKVDALGVARSENAAGRSWTTETLFSKALMTGENASLPVWALTRSTALPITRSRGTLLSRSSPSTPDAKGTFCGMKTVLPIPLCLSTSAALAISSNEGRINPVTFSDKAFSIAFSYVSSTSITSAMDARICSVSASVRISCENSSCVISLRESSRDEAEANSSRAFAIRILTSSRFALYPSMSARSFSFFSLRRRSSLSLAISVPSVSLTFRSSVAS